MRSEKNIEQAYLFAKERYAALGIDTDKAIQDMQKVVISLHCWQADDVSGLEKPDSSLGGGGIQATGNYPGKSRNIDELRQDIEKVLTLLPGKQKLNLHAMYGDFGGTYVDRNKIEPKHYKSWVDWAKKAGTGLDFNSSCFSHPMAESGFTLSDSRKDVRDFWIEHVNRCRDISAYMGKELEQTVIHNIWIPDGSKDLTVNRLAYRQNLKDSLDTIFKKEQDPKLMKDCIECKLFGIGSEAFVVGSHEFYMGYGFTNKRMITLDMGHFHPTESIADKISSVLLFSPEIMLHVSRGVRWDSDHVVILNDDIFALAQEIIRANALDRMYIGLDFFDASINRVGAYVVGTRSAQKGFLSALLEPIAKLREYEANGQLFERLALLEEAKTLPMGAVWDYYCHKENVPVAEDFIPVIQQYEKDVTSKR